MKKIIKINKLLVTLKSLPFFNIKLHNLFKTLLCQTILIN